MLIVNFKEISEDTTSRKEKANIEWRKHFWEVNSVSARVQNLLHRMGNGKSTS